MTQRKRDPEMFKLKYKEHLGVARQLLEAAIKKCDVICGTPIALGQLGIPSQWKPDFIVLDEASRMQESLSAILFAKLPRAAPLLIGDTLQCSPMSLTTSIDSRYKDIFGPQTTISLFARGEARGRLNFTLRKNYRARGTVAGNCFKSWNGSISRSPRSDQHIAWTIRRTSTQPAILRPPRIRNGQVSSTAPLAETYYGQGTTE